MIGNFPEMIPPKLYSCRACRASQKLTIVLPVKNISGYLTSLSKNFGNFEKVGKFFELEYFVKY